jgi:hypothetical protein
LNGCCILFFSVHIKFYTFVGAGAGAIGAEEALRYGSGSTKMMRLLLRYTDQEHLSFISSRFFVAN